MNSKNPKFWALIGFGVGAVLAAAGTMSSPFESLVGGLIQAAIWYGISSLILRKKNETGNFNRNTISNSAFKDSEDKKSIKSESIRTCDECKSTVPATLFTCGNCGGTKFTHDKVVSGFNQESSEEALGRIFSSSKTEIKTESPQYKNCPMCDEQIRFAAKKCRFCQHILQM